MHFEDPYEILGLKPGASDEEVKAAYEQLSSDAEKAEQAKAAYAQICAAGEEKTEETPAAEEPAEEKPAEASAEETPAEEKKEEEKKATPGQLALGVAAIVILAAVLAALILAAMGGKDAPAETLPAETAPASVSTEAPALNELTEAPAETTPATTPADGNPDDETCKGTYTASDEEVIAAADRIVATIDGYELTNAQLQIYYWMGIQSYVYDAGNYIQFLGLDVSKPLDTQPCALAEGRSWQQFFLKQALTSWQNYQAMAAEAQENGREMDEELKSFLADLPDQMEQQAQENGFADAKAMLANNVGAGASIEDYLHFMEIYNMGYGYFLDALDAEEPGEEELEAYMNEHEEELKETGITRDGRVVSARHILISPEDPDSEEDWKEAEKKAQEILDTYLAGDKTSESFAKLATENTMDPGSASTGGLYEDIAQGQMVPEFDQWCFDAARVNGDTGIVKTTYGYHIMYFVSSHSIWQEQVSQVIMKNTADRIIAEGAEKYPLEVDYSQILLGELKAQ